MPALAFGEEPTVISSATGTAVEAPPPGQGVLAPPDLAPSSEAAAPAAEPQPDAVLPTKTVVIVMLDQDLTTADSKLGDLFQVTVVEDVKDADTIVIPKGTIGSGEITFVTNKGGFGKPGILGIALRYLNMNGKHVALDGRYREEGKNNAGAAAATWFAVGIFAGFVKGKAGVIPKGRELKARTGEDIPFLRLPAAAAATRPEQDPAEIVGTQQPQAQPDGISEGEALPAIAQHQTAF